MNRTLKPTKPSFYNKLEPFIPLLSMVLIIGVPFIISVLLVMHEGILPSVQGGI